MTKLDIVKIDDRRFKEAIRGLVKEVPIQAQKVVLNEARLLVEDLVDRTKPVVGRLKKRIKGTIGRTMIASRLPTATGSVPMAAYRATRAKKPPRRAFLVKPDAVRKLIATQNLHVGWFASGWLGSGNPLSAKKGVPGNVKRHAGQGKTILIKIPLLTRVTVRNLSRFVEHIPGLARKMTQILNAAFKSRSSKMLKNLELIRSGIKKYKAK